MTSNNFPITVLMASYNVERYVAEAVQSILSQTYANFEFLIIDDGSLDRTPEILRTLSVGDPRIRLILNAHYGIARTLNKGLKLAKYDWVAFMDADDISLPQRLQEEINYLKENPDVKVVATYGRYMGPDGKRILGYFNVGPVTREEFYERIKNGKLIYLIHPSVIVDRGVALEIGGFRDVPGGTDVDIWNRISDRYLIQTIPPNLFLYRVHSTSTTVQTYHLQERAFRFVQECTRSRRAGVSEPSYGDFVQGERNRSTLSQIRDRTRAHAIYFYRYAGIEGACNNWFTAIGYLFCAFVLNPRYVLNKLFRHSGLKQRVRSLKWMRKRRYF